jgi:hypothetical protein
VRPRLLLALALGLGLLAGCSHAPVQPERRLILSVQPAELAPGMLVRVSARPEPDAALASVSGTVAVPGAWVMPFHWDAQQKAWAFRTVIPSLIAIPAGEYTVKAWGETADGRRYQGSTTVRFH